MGQSNSANLNLPKPKIDMYTRLRPVIDTSRECPICFEKNVDVETFCGHAFHKECIRRCMAKDVRCPSCRSEVVVIRGEYTGPAVLIGTDMLHIPHISNVIHVPTRFIPQMITAQERGLLFALDGDNVYETSLIPVAYTKNTAYSAAYIHALSDALRGLALV